MTGFLTELGTKLADRWLTLLVLPGALLVAAVGTAETLGQAHALDVALLRARITAVAGTPGARSPGALLLAVGGILAASALAGLAASALGAAISHLWTAASPARPPAGFPGAKGLTARISWLHPGFWLTTLRAWSWRRRDERWQAVQAASLPMRQAAALLDAGITTAATARPQNPGGSLAAASPAAPTISTSQQIIASSKAAISAADAALSRRNRIALLKPSRPTWIGDRIQSAETRIATAYDLDISVAWPRLWAVLPDNLRADLSAAHDAFTESSRLVGWALLYTVISVWWWPSLLIAAAAGVTGWARGRAAAAVLADLIEATVDLHGRTLAAQLGIACDEPLNPSIGYEITKRLRRDLA